MAVKIAVVKVYNEILEETKTNIMITDAQGIRYLGGLCYPSIQWIGERIEEIIVEKEVELDEVISNYINMAIGAGLKVYDSTEESIRWWGYLNGLFPEYIHE